MAAQLLDCTARALQGSRLGYVSAFIFQGQLTEARRGTRIAADAFRTDERAWIELEPIKPTFLAPADKKFPAAFSCEIYLKNVGKTVARDVSVKAQSLFASDRFGNNAEVVKNTQDKFLLSGNKEAGTGKPVLVPRNPLSRVLAPNTVSVVPFKLGCMAPQAFPSGYSRREYIVGRIDYCDEFRVKHWLKFCFYVADAKGEVWACQEGNDEDRNSESPTQENACGINE